MSLFASNSGNGFHGIGLVAKESWYDFWDKTGNPTHKIGSYEPYGEGTKETTGLAVDIFLPGAKFLVAVNLNKPIVNTHQNHVLPRLSPSELNDLLNLSLGS